jgi:dihydroorotate dehydrogenase electron transfer subunit
LPGTYTHVYACGPEPMLRALHRTVVTGGSFSFEARMGCGFGACMGCSCKTITGSKRICKEGPVLQKEEILWAD